MIRSIQIVKQAIKRTPLYPYLSPLVSAYRERRNEVIFNRYLRPDDVFLVGHPKSGNTWLAYMLAILVNNDRDGMVNLNNIGMYVPVIHLRDSDIEKFPHLERPRTFRNESPEFPDKYPKTIYIMRDPRSVLVSYYHMYKTLFSDDEKTLGSFVEDYIRHGCIPYWEPRIVRWDKQVVTFIERAKTDDSIMVVKYESLVEETGRIMMQIADFIGSVISQDLLQLILNRGSFKEMKKNERKYGAESYQGEAGKRGNFIRRGRIDGWKDEMPEDIIRLINNEFSSAMHMAGYFE